MSTTTEQTMSVLHQCPSCWEEFQTSAVKWISDFDIRDDYFLNDNSENRRFSPERFTPDNLAIDVYTDPETGMETEQICQRRFACPYCHLELPEEYLLREPFVISIVGTQQAGKSFFHTAFHQWLWKSEEPGEVGLVYEWIQTKSNAELAKRRERLFPELSIADSRNLNLRIIPATDHMDNTKAVEKSGRIFNYPTPFMEGISSQDTHKEYVLCLYDHAGENFRSSNVSKYSAPMLKHIATGNAIFFVYDPTQIPKCVKEYKGSDNEYVGAEKKIMGHAGQDGENLRGEMVDTEVENGQLAIFNSMVRLIRDHNDSGQWFNADGKFTRPLVVLAVKCDAWKGMLPPPVSSLLDSFPESMDVVEAMSPHIKRFIEKTCDDKKFVQAVENFSIEPIYIPVSATGCNPQVEYRHDTDEDDNEKTERVEGFIPGTLNPLWVGVPFLYVFLKHDYQE